MPGLLLRLIACLEIAGGLYGLMTSLLHWPALHWSAATVYAGLALLLFGASLAAGVGLLEGRAWGRRGSLWLQFLQIPLLASPVLSYGFHCGGFVQLYFSLQHAPKLHWNWHWASQGLLLAPSGPPSTRVGVNLLAMASWWLLRFR